MTHGFDIRERLGFMREHPTNCAITREGFLVQAITWLLVAGVSPVDVELAFLPAKMNDASTPEAKQMMASLIQSVSIGDWAHKTIDKALSMLPNPCVVSVTREQP